MTTPETNTAADRLLRIMRTVDGADQNENLIGVWTRALHLQSPDKLKVFRGILSLAELINEVEVVVGRHGGAATKLYQRSLDGVRHILMVNIESNRHTLRTILTPQIMIDLEHCAAMYSSIDHEIPIASEEVNAVKEKIEELFQEVTDSNFPEELRLQLLDLLEVMRRQMSQFEIRGVTALHECLRQSLARLMEIYPSGQSYKKEPIFKKLFGIMTDINTLCDVGQKAFLAWKIAEKFLPLLTSDASNLIPNSVEVEPVLEEKI